MAFGTPKRKSGLPAPSPGGILSARKSKLQTPQSRKRLTSHLKSPLKSGGSSRKSLLRGGSAVATTPTPILSGAATPARTPTAEADATLEVAKRSLDESSDASPEKESETRKASSPSDDPTVSDEDAGEAVKVGVRIRPLPGPANEPRAFALGAAANSIVRNVGGDATYQYNRVYGEDSSSQQLYDDMASDIVASVVNQGRNGTVFTYGQTASGKTHTMHGLLEAAGKDLFQTQLEGDGYLIQIAVACMELYNEELRDLLCPGSLLLSVQEDRQGNVQIPGVTEQLVHDVDHLMDVIREADEKRTIGATAMNKRSSRSHTIFQITYTREEYHAIGTSLDDGDCEDKENDNAGSSVWIDKKRGHKVVTTVSTLNLVDLAGSESVRVTGAKGERQKEGGKINQSLLALSRVLSKLGKKERGHIGYRDSKLTRILKPSLSGNARMGCICCISPEVRFAEESKSTLDFASRTMLVTTNAQSNQTVEYDDALIEGYEREIEQAKREASEAEERRLEMARSLQEAEEQIVCLRATVELETSKASTLERQSQDHLAQLEELKAAGDDRQNLLEEIEKLKARVTQETGKVSSLEKKNEEQLAKLEALEAVGDEKEVLSKEVNELKTCVTQYEAANEKLKAELEQERDSFRQEQEDMAEDREKQAEKHELEVEALKEEVLQRNKEKEDLEATHAEMQAKLTHSQKLETLSAVNADKNDELQGRMAELEKEIATLKSEKETMSEEKLQIEWKLAREKQKSKRRKEDARERRQRFKGKLAGMAETMKDSLKEDMIKRSYEKDF
ncbi:hypothetical protein ACHAXT_008635 [Thalassiosira profunda]